MKPRELVFSHIDFWGRPRFIDFNGNYFGNVDILFEFNATAEEVSEQVTEQNMQYFGTESDCDPDGRFIKPDRIKIVKEFSNDIS